MKKIENIIKNHIVGEIFSEFPTDLDNTEAFDFFLQADIDDTDFVGDSPLSAEWGFETCEQYDYEDIKALRGLMQSQLEDLFKLQDTIHQECTLRISIFKSDMDGGEFSELKNKPTANINRNGTNDEYVTFKTLRLGDMK